MPGPCPSSRRAIRSGPSPTRSARSFSRARPSLGWWFGFGIAFALVNVLMISIAYLLCGGHGHLGHQHSGRLGLRDYQLRVVDRHRPRRHADLGDPAALQADMAHLDQPLCRGDDAVRRRERGDIPAAAHRPAVARDLLAVPVSEHDGRVAAVPQPAHLGRLRGLDVRHGLAAVLVRRTDSRPRDAARSLGIEGRTRDLRRAGDGMARLGAPLASLRDGVSAARGARDAARRLGAHDRELRLRGVGDPRLARDGLPAVLRRRRHLLGIRDGADARDSHPQDLRAAGFHHRAPPEQHGEDPARHGAHRRLRLHDRSVHGVVQREHVRDLHDAQPDERAVRAVLLGADRLQRPDAAAALDQEDPHERGAALHHLADRERRHVARALRHRRHVAASRLPAFVVGPLFADDLGLGLVRRHDRLVPVAAVPVPALPPDDFDLRDAHARAGRPVRRFGSARLQSSREGTR